MLKGIVAQDLTRPWAVGPANLDVNGNGDVEFEEFFEFVFANTSDGRFLTEEEEERANKDAKGDGKREKNDTKSQEAINQEEPKIADLSHVARQWARQKQIHSE